MSTLDWLWNHRVQWGLPRFLRTKAIFDLNK
jgi:hypothetical protein